MTYQEIIEEVSKNTGVDSLTIGKTYRAFWRFIRDTIQSLPLKDSMTEEEFNSLRPNFNIPSLGKLTCTYSRYRGVKEKFNHIKKLRNENTQKSKANVQ